MSAGGVVGALLEEIERVVPPGVEWDITVASRSESLPGVDGPFVALRCRLDGRGALWEVTPELMKNMGGREDYLARTAVESCRRAMGL